jgi:hypothetical protein
MTLNKKNHLFQKKTKQNQLTQTRSNQVDDVVVVDEDRRKLFIVFVLTESAHTICAIWLRMRRKYFF